VLQLFPFGWMKADGTPHREEIYLNMVEAANCTYTRWTNKRWDHSYLRKCGGQAQQPALLVSLFLSCWRLSCGCPMESHSGTYLTGASA